MTTLNGYTPGKASSMDRISPVGEPDGSIMLIREDVKSPESHVLLIKESHLGVSILGEFP